MRHRSDWFQGRELVEALAVRLAASAGQTADAARRYSLARDQADASDFYSAAWLTAECADVLLNVDPALVRESVNRYAERVRSLRAGPIRKRFEALLAS